MRKKGLAYGKSGFKVPKDYFGSFEARMLDKINSLPQENELQTGREPFKVPENYFEDFEKRMLIKIKQEPKATPVIPLFGKRTLSYIAGIAAVLAVILTSAVLNHNHKATFEDLDMLAVENYLFETLDISNPEETPMIDHKEISFAQSMDANFDREAVLEYLNENIDEPAILLNED
ncbi:MAG: hypothetical protein WBL21_08740 [Salinimicrobium sp.]